MQLSLGLFFITEDMLSLTTCVSVSEVKGGVWEDLPEWSNKR